MVRPPANPVELLAVEGMADTMFNHMVLFRFGDDDTADAVVRRVRELAATIDEVADLVIGRDELGSPRSFDVGMLMRFSHAGAFARYNAHPDHVDAAAWIDGVAAEAVAVDWTD